MIECQIIVTLLLAILDTWFKVSNPRFLGVADHLRPFSGASEVSEGNEQGGGAVGGQGQLQGV